MVHAVSTVKDICVVSDITSLVTNVAIGGTWVLIRTTPCYIPCTICVESFSVAAFRHHAQTTTLAVILATANAYISQSLAPGTHAYRIAVSLNLLRKITDRHELWLVTCTLPDYVKLRFSRRWLWRISSSGMLRRVALVWTDVSEALSDSIIKYTNSVAFSPQANYTDWATATCWRNLVPTFADRRVSRGRCGGSLTVVNLSFLDRSR
jgi:hypothetical protein